jgi:hypothetical protein
LRFRAPQPPKVNKTIVQNGSFTATCPQGIPVWQGNILGVVRAYLAGKPYSESAFEADVANFSFPIPDVNEGTSEDCLFLDVYSSKKAFDKASKPAPVLVWVCFLRKLLLSLSTNISRSMAAVLSLGRKQGQATMIMTQLD